MIKGKLQAQQQMAKLYQSSRTNVVEHLKHIFDEGELDENSTCRKFRQVQKEGGRSVDYDPNTPESVEFFKIVQNKLHYAAHGHTAAEVVYQRVDSDKPFMGLTVFPGEQPTSKDITVAKNYLNTEELKIRNNLVSGYFDFAEIRAIKRKPMYMADYIKQLDSILSATGEKIFLNAGAVSYQKALEKAKAEFKKYQVKTLSPVEKDYLENIKALQKKIDQKGGKK